MQPELQNIPINQIHVAANYRKTFNDKSLKELAQSIKVNGVIEPIIVRPSKTGFLIVAGERRYRASKLAGIVSIPAVVRDVADEDILKFQIIENVQREGVPYMEEAYAIKKLRDECVLDVKEIAAIIGKSDAYVYMQLKLTAMPEEVQDAFRKGWINKGVAWEITKLPNTDYQSQAARDLSRPLQGHQVSANRARFYISSTFGPQKAQGKQQNSVQKATGNDFAANWKKYLVHFTVEQFEQFKKVVRGRTDTSVLSEAVDVVMRGG